jgi:uncharacterized phage protein gp47/JayE
VAYFEPLIDETGYHYPTYNEILEHIVINAKLIFGQGIYLGTDSQDYQLMSVFARIAYDSYSAFGLAYDAHSPRTSIGVGLDSVVSINGIRRKQGSRSAAEVVLTGRPNLYIPKGIVGDVNGHLWDLSEGITLDNGGYATVTALCQEVGDIVALSNTITTIMTPMLGWVSVTNPAISATGSLIETDAELRARQVISVAQPSVSLIDAVRSGIAAIQDVARYRAEENDTKAPFPNGHPANSIWAVVEGGDATTIAETLRLRKSLGCGTYGNTSITTENSYGYDNIIRFSRPIVIDIDVAIQITPLSGYTSEMIDGIKGKVVDYINGLKIGDVLTSSIIWWAAQNALYDSFAPSFSVRGVQIGRLGGVLSAADIGLAFEEVARGNTNNVAITIA